MWISWLFFVFFICPASKELIHRHGQFQVTLFENINHFPKALDKRGNIVAETFSPFRVSRTWPKRKHFVRNIC